MDHGLFTGVDDGLFTGIDIVFFSDIGDDLFPGIENGQYQWSTMPLVNTSGQHQYLWSVPTFLF